jgi:acyl-ACP thioesterase
MPVRIFDDIKEKWSFFPEESIRYDVSKKIEAIDSARYKKDFHVHRYDMDSNKHVNNLRYLQWLIETIPNEIIDNCFLYSIDGRFVGEAQYGHRIESLTENENDTLKFIHTIKDLDTTLICSTGRTVWKRKD